MAIKQVSLGGLQSGDISLSEQMHITLMMCGTGVCVTCAVHMHGRKLTCMYIYISIYIYNYNIYIYVCVYIYVYIIIVYIYVYARYLRARVKERERDVCVYVCMLVSVYRLLCSQGSIEVEIELLSKLMLDSKSNC